jgi:hypothetical protein
MATRFGNTVIDDQVVPSEWIAMEHYRLHTVEAWPESPYKDVTLASIHSSLAGLLRDATTVQPQECSICRSRRSARTVVELPSRSRIPVRPSVAA